MTPYFSQDGITLYHGDCREVMQSLPDESVDAVVTDPPYGLSFMGKRWDYDVPSVEVWEQCLRVLKPGGHLLAFAGTRTQHRMAVRIEDAGFEIRDMIAWVYGSGFPKSLDVSKAIDKMDAKAEQHARRLRFTAWMRQHCSLTARQANELIGCDGEASHFFTDGEQPHIATRAHFELLRPHFTAAVPDDIEAMVTQRSVQSENMAAREVLQTKTQRLTDASTWAQNSTTGMFSAGEREYAITAPATEDAKRWQGWGTALKPSQETVTWARKPLTDDGERHTITTNLIKLEAKIWLLWNALPVERNSVLSQSEYAEALSIAQWTAGSVTSTQADLCGQMDTSQYAAALSTCWNIVQSWKRSWAGVLNHGSTSTISTAANQIIDQKTLSCCLLQITPENMLRGVSQAGGLKSNADTAVRFVYDCFACCESIHTLFATGNAIAKDAERFRGEAVSPGMEQIVLARKPLSGTVAENVLTHGCGGLNVDGCRVGTEVLVNAGMSSLGVMHDDNWKPKPVASVVTGRWPANLIHDGSDEVTRLFPETAPSKAVASVTRKNGVLKHGGQNARPSHNTTNRVTEAEGYDDAGGSAARFFYTAKADKADRGHGNKHPTVKPVDLMRYLVRLVCPMGGLVLDPFAGSGTTLVAAQAEHCRAIGIEREEQYCEFIRDERFRQRVLF